MMTSEKSSPIEVWLTEHNMEVTCRYVRQDETTNELDVNSLSIAGAQREITGHLLANGYEGAGRWAEQVPGETMRRFRLKETNPA